MQLEEIQTFLTAAQLLLPVDVDVKHKITQKNRLLIKNIADLNVIHFSFTCNIGFKDDARLRVRSVFAASRLLLESGRSLKGSKHLNMKKKKKILHILEADVLKTPLSPQCGRRRLSPDGFRRRAVSS